MTLAYNSALAKKVSNGDSTAVTSEDLNTELTNQGASASESNPIKVTFYASKRLYTINNGSIEYEASTETEDMQVLAGPKIKIGEEEVILTKENVRNYMGKIITNYKNIDTTENITIDSNTYTVSTTYRLYYVDFDNDYGEGAGTVYLKADCLVNNKKSLQLDGAIVTSKIYELNPNIKTNGPIETNNNMKATIWLLDTAKWNGLKLSGASTEIGDNVIYVVGAPSIEMMMDSYNQYYEGTGREIIQRSYTTGDYGYSTVVGMGSIATDSNIDTMYYPGDDQDYWVGSPGIYGENSTLCGSCQFGGVIVAVNHNGIANFCPLVCLSPNTELQISN